MNSLFQTHKSSFFLVLGLQLSSIYLIVDTVNGFLLRNAVLPISISIIFKLLLIGIFLFSMDKKNFLIALFPAVLIFLFLDMHILYLNGFGDVFGDFQWMFKFYLIVLSYLFFRYVIDHYPHLLEKIFFIVKLSFAILALNIFAGAVGIGYKQYEDSIGSIGFIYAGNEMSLAIIVSGAIILFYLLEKRKIAAYFLFSLLFIAVAVLKVTKIAVIGSFIMVLFLPLIAVLPQLTTLKVDKSLVKIFTIALTLFLVSFPAAIYIALYKLDLISRLSYWLDKTDLVTVIFSHRNIWAGEALDMFWNSYSNLELFFGIGRPMFLALFGQSVEIDPVDMLMAYGIFGVLLIYSYFIYMVGLAFQKSFSEEHIYAKYIVFIGLFVIAVSFTAGHVVTSGIAGILAGLLFALLHAKKETGTSGFLRGEA